MMSYKHKIRENYKFYSQDLLNNLFKHPYTKIEFVVNDLNVSRITAANYLNKLADGGLLTKKKLETGNYYINEPLFNLLTNRQKNVLAASNVKKRQGCEMQSVFLEEELSA
ncbi:MAG: DNA-binding protein [Bacteroidales bacterium]|nr:DNA-binding protein [Bacteroidales bacterium]MCF8336715.1 DNA-binding protein [Bacteroidales bacterium]